MTTVAFAGSKACSPDFAPRNPGKGRSKPERHSLDFVSLHPGYDSINRLDL